MAVDKGYGSGYKNSGKAKPAAPRARRARGSAKPNTPLSQMSRAEYNARIVQGQGARRRSNGNFSANALENLTGFNSRDGVDAGDIAGLALAIPAGLGGAILKGAARVARAVTPTATKVARAATRVSRAAKAKGKARESMLDYEYSQMRGNQDFAKELRGLPKSGWDLDQFGGFRNISRTTRRSDIAESAYEIQSKLDALKRAKKNR